MKGKQDDISEVIQDKHLAELSFDNDSGEVNQ